MENNNKIVVVIHIQKYNKAQFEKTIQSLLKQTTKIDVFVLDNSNSTNLVKRIEKLDKGIHNINYKASTNDSIPEIMLETISHISTGRGDRVLFLSSGDSICRDYCRKLSVTMDNYKADIVVTDWVWEKPKGDACYIPYEEFRNMDFELNNNEILEKYICGHGYNFTWDLISNKLYSINLLKKAQKDLENLVTVAKNNVMGLSFMLYAHATKLVNCHNNPCFLPYDTKPNAVTIGNRQILEEYQGLFTLLEDKLTELHLNQKLNKDFDVYKNKILTQLQSIVKANEFQKIFGDKKYETKCVEMSTFTVDFGKEFQKYEKILEAIISKKTEIVSFDIFDTLISRSCLDPKDIFTALGYLFRDELSNAFFLDFKSLRESAEIEARCKYSHGEIEIYDIYNYMVEQYGFDKNLADRILKKEIELELEYSIPRNTGKDLYEIALENNKKVIYTSDMYLPQEAIFALLEKNGYSRANRLFLSCEYKLSKGQGTLYTHILTEFNVSGNQIVHIGDNYGSDYVQAGNKNIKAFYIPNSTEMFYNRLLQPLKYDNISLSNEWGLEAYMGTKMMCAIVARKLFDFPYIQQVSTFQCSPRYIGYYALGMHLYALVDWIQNTIVGKYDTIHFIARDGYLPLKAYEIFTQYYSNLPKSNYLYLSRKFLYPLSIYESKDVFSSTGQLTWSTHSINKCLSYFPDDCLNQIEIEKIPMEQRTSTFVNIDAFYKNIPIIDNCIYYDKLKDYHTSVINQYLNIVKPNDILFDIGYTGRQETILSKLLGYSIDSIYLHTRVDWAKFNFDKSKSKNYTFYNFLPKISFHIREMIFMSLELSLKGYNCKENAFEFVQNNTNTEEINTIINTLHSNALQFIQDFFKYHYAHKGLIAYEKELASLPWDIYLLNSNMLDRTLFIHFNFEDDIGAGQYKLRDSWNNAYSRKPKLLIRLANKCFPKGTKRRYRIKQLAIKLFPKGSKRRQFAKKLLGR